MTKLLQWTPFLEQEFQKKDDFHNGTIRVSKCSTLTIRPTGGHNQLLLNASTASKPGRKILELNLGIGIVIAGEPIHAMRAPKLTRLRRFAPSAKIRNDCFAVYPKLV